MSKVDINFFPYMERMLLLPENTGERLEEALSYIDFVVKILLRYHHNMTPKRVRALIKEAQINWDKLVDKNIVVNIDPTDNEEQFLDSINFPEMFIFRILESAGDDQDKFNTLLNISKNLCAFMDWGNLKVIEDCE